MKRLEVFINVLLLAVVVAAACFLYWAWREQAKIYAHIKREIETQATQALGLPVEVGAIEGLWWQDLKISSVRVRSHAGKGAPTAVFVPEIRARYSIPEILRLGRKPVEVEVLRPLVTLARDERGTFSVRPKARPPEPPGELPKLPIIHVTVKDGAIEWLDRFQATSSQVVPFARRIPLDRADATLRKGQLTWIADLRDAKAELHARGRHDVDRASGEASMRVTGVDLPTWGGYGAPSDDYRILAGAADAVAAVGYDLADARRTRVGGQVWIKDLTLEHKDVLAPVEDVSVEAAFDRKKVTVRKVAASVLGNAVTGGGTVDIRDPLKPQLALDFAIPRFDLAAAPVLVPELTSFGLSGSVGATARVHGSALDPVIEADIRLERAMALKEALGPGTARARVHHMKAEVSDIAIAVHGGTATGNFWFTMDQHPVAGGRIAFDGVGLGPAAAPWLPRPLPLYGRVSGVADISGPMEALLIAGDATIRGGIGRQTVDHGFLRFRIARSNITVSDLLLTAPGGGRLTGDIGWNDGGDLVMSLAATDFDLGALRRGGLDVDLAGRARITLEAAGNMLAPDSLEWSGRIAAADGAAWGQPIAEVSGDYRIAAGRIDLSDVVGQVAGARVAGGGHIAPISFERDLGPPDVHLEFDAAGGDLAGLTAVQQAAAEPLGGLTGTLSAYGVKLRVARGVLAVSGRLAASDVDAPRVGRASQVAGQIDLVGERLSLADVVIEQGAQGIPERSATGSAAVRLAGEVMLGKRPTLGLHLRTEGADARTLLGGIHWRRLLQGTWILRRPDAGGAGGTLVPYVQLPDRERIEMASEDPLDFSAVFRHWQTTSKEPLLSDEQQLQAAKPFWEAVDGVVDAEIRLDGAAADPYIFAEVDVAGGRVYGHALAKASVLAWYGRGELAVDHLDLEAKEGGAIHAGGALGQGRSLEVTATDLELGWLNPWLQAADITLSGRAGGRVVASGELGRPRLDISAAALRGHISDFVYDRAGAEAVLENGQLSIKQFSLEKDGKEARVAGSLPIGLRPEDTGLNLQLDVRGQGLGIVSILSKGLIDWRGGDGTLHVDIIGTQADPRLRGALKLQGARIAVKTLEGEISDIDAEAQIGAGIVKVERLRARHGGGRLEGTGFITLEQFKFGSYFLDVWTSETTFKTTNGLFDGQVDGHMRVGGKFERPTITGELTISKGKLALNNAQGGGGGPAEPGTPVDLSGLNLDIKDTVNVVQPNLMNVRVKGNLILNGTLMQPDFKGLVNVVPGGTITTFYTNTFKVDEGSTVEFLGSGRPSEEGDLLSEILGEERSGQSVAAAVPNARVRVVATTTVVDYENLHPEPGEVREAAGGSLATHKPKTVNVKATITGTLTDLKFSFVADPPSYTQAEIETLLGKPQAITGFISALAPRSTDSADTGGVLRTVGRDVGYGAATWFANQFLKTTLDPVLGTVLSDYGLDLIGDPTRTDLLSGFNLGLYFQTKSLGPLSASYRRVVNTSRTQSQGDTKRYGVNMLGIPLNIGLQGTFIDWLTPNAVIQDLGVTAFLEDTAGFSGEFPPTFDELFIGGPTNPWRASIQIGIRGRL
ncbi:MAG: translocation/assembly module TamB domain-containing protein [Candidatus Sericytochromatia bacterium]|nr:translocation/assembly module TamB domain-containing protein [Candidatus Tanganyikabacteria bacterium]